MGLKKLRIDLNNLFLILTAIFVVMGVLGVFKDYCIPLSITNTLLFLGIKLIKNDEIKLPKNIGIFIFFLLVLLLHTYFYKGKIIWFWMFFSGGLYWVSIYNLRNIVNKYFSLFLISVGILMCFIFIYFKSRGITFFSPDNLFLPIRADIMHNHIGDLWAFILVLITYKALEKFKYWHIPLILIALVFISISLSRSSIVALLAGLTYLGYKFSPNSDLDNLKKYAKPFLTITILIAILIFVYFSIYKSTFFARPYYSEAIRSTIQSPLGIGMGNFPQVSPETNIVHNLILEVMCGMGIYSLVFIYWLYKTGRTIFENKESNILYIALLITMFVNFMFDTTYVIPGLFWIWFILLALVL